MRLVVFLHGPIGAGKTTLGRVLARRLPAPFIDGDDLSRSGEPWLRSIRQTSRRILAAAISASQDHGVVLVGYPLRCRDWYFFQEHFHRSAIRTLFVGLTASIEALDSPFRGRMLDPGERLRTAEMLAEGYGARPFSDLTIDTAACSTADAACTIERAIVHLTSNHQAAMSRPS